MISIDEKNTDTITEKELLEIDAVENVAETHNAKPHHKSINKSTWFLLKLPTLSTLPILFIIFMTISLLAGMGYLIYHQLAMLEQSLAETSQKTLKALKQDKILFESDRQLAAQVVVMQKQLAEMGGQQQDIQSKLSRMTDHTEDHWLLAEALYLSRLAVERLQSTQDVKTAIVQLTAADDRLRQLADPSLLPVRKILIDKITALRLVIAPDFEGLWLQLGVMSEMADKLVFIKTDNNKLTDTVVDNTGGWQAVFKRSWIGLKNLITVRSPEENATHPLLASQTLTEFTEAGVKRGFRLLIEQSRWALIQRENWLYQGSIAHAQKWLKSYFRQEATAQLMYTQLEQLKSQPVNLSLPDISDTVTAIHAVIQARQGNKHD